ncbi:hypothetical protein ABIG04_004659 [Bradyrhizobium japonicum]
MAAEHYRARKGKEISHAAAAVVAGGYTTKFDSWAG